MIVGIGTDVIRISRVKKAMERTPGFETRVFSTEEIEYCNSMAFPDRHFAVRFAAKEAFMKALGTGWAKGIRFEDIIVQRNEDGQPYIEVQSPTRDLIPQFSQLNLWVSLAHDGDVAIATVVIEQQMDLG